ncbi:hypothetical protein GOP47_0012354 [Adiantum capillus-veneris]|uniref:Diphthine--ammonia ligase n=1 Tax=Adiantum capillus-veneris TaxID=13818 RepID=A0A9D4ZE84_ADICA|nr:hypothetical protein GOP47_0012354 [Adiantum capillus-veneris]
MKVVALISGGKDSCYAMMRCIDHGHEIVALANLLPMDESVDELDSFMYQTVGHQVVVAYAQCMGLPLYRRRIRGSSRLQELRYTQTEYDEVEDLFLLLRAVQIDFPELGAVSSGAIASDYQRMRVENVCSRLGLISLAYLWKQEQDDLLQQMIAGGINAVLVKVAAMGLNPHTHLGKNLADMQPFLRKLNMHFGINVCGEGGEYETLTLDCPLFKHYRISLDEFDIVQHSPDTIAPVGVLHPSKFHLETKISTSSALQPTSEPFVKDIGVEFEESLVTPKEADASSAQSWQSVSRLDILSDSCARRHGAFAVHSLWTKSRVNDLGIEEELGFLLTAIQKDLKEDGLSWGDVLYIHLYLNDMETFMLANQTYMQVITEKLCINGVPSRSTVGIDLLGNNLGRVMVEAVVAKKMVKKVLHVQSISCWAPSCIGPYSQATVCHDMLYMAGQLGLDPPTMALVCGGPASEMKQALKNCEAVALAFSVSIMRSCVSILVYCSSSVQILERKEAETVLENFLRSTERFFEPPIVYVKVRALPKGAAIEVEPFLYAPCYGGESSESSSELRRFRRGERCQGTIVPERSFRAFYSIPFNVVLKDVDTANRDFAFDLGSLPFICAELELCLQIFSEMLAEACLDWQNVLAFRVMFDSKLVSDELVVAAWNYATNSSGRDMNMDDLVTLDLLAFP